MEQIATNLWRAVAGYVLVLFPMGYLTAALFGSSSSDDASWENSIYSLLLCIYIFVEMQIKEAKFESLSS